MQDTVLLFPDTEARKSVLCSLTLCMRVQHPQLAICPLPFLPQGYWAPFEISVHMLSLLSVLQVNQGSYESQDPIYICFQKSWQVILHSASGALFKEFSWSVESDLLKNKHDLALGNQMTAESDVVMAGSYSVICVLKFEFRVQDQSQFILADLADGSPLSLL